MEVAACVGTTFLAVFWVVFGFWFVLHGALSCGFYGYFSLVCMAQHCGFLVVEVDICWAWFGVFSGGSVFLGVLK